MKKNQQTNKQIRCCEYISSVGNKQKYSYTTNNPTLNVRYDTNDRLQQTPPMHQRRSIAHELFESSLDKLQLKGENRGRS